MASLLGCRWRSCLYIHTIHWKMFVKNRMIPSSSQSFIQNPKRKFDNFLTWISFQKYLPIEKKQIADKKIITAKFLHTKFCFTRITISSRKTLLLPPSFVSGCCTAWSGMYSQDASSSFEGMFPGFVATSKQLTNDHQLKNLTGTKKK